ncbi:MAG: aminoacyl-tRNA deacylase [Actinomycetota bacterium]
MSSTTYTCRQRLEEYFIRNDVGFAEQHHPTAFTAQEVAASDHVSGRIVAKVVMVRADGRLAMLVVPAPKRVDLGKAAAALGAADLRLAHEEEFAEVFPDCEPGAMPPFGNLYEVPVCTDRALAENLNLVFQAGTHTESMGIRFEDYERLVQPDLADLTED